MKNAAKQQQTKLTNNNSKTVQKHKNGKQHKTQQKSQ